MLLWIDKFWWWCGFGFRWYAPFFGVFFHMKLQRAYHRLQKSRRAQCMAGECVHGQCRLRLELKATMKDFSSNISSRPLLLAWFRYIDRAHFSSLSLIRYCQWWKLPGRRSRRLVTWLQESFSRIHVLLFAQPCDRAAHWDVDSASSQSLVQPVQSVDGVLGTEVIF